MEDTRDPHIPDETFPSTKADRDTETWPEGDNCIKLYKFELYFDLMFVCFLTHTHKIYCILL